MTKAMFAGSFDPIHRGHVAVIEAAARLFSELWVVAMGNPSKRSGLLSLTERGELITASTAHLSNVRVVTSGGLLTELAQSLGVSALVRSVGKERVSEFEMAHANSCLTGVDTVFLLPGDDLAHISSSLVRERFLAGELDGLDELVPAPVALGLRSRSSA